MKTWAERYGISVEQVRRLRQIIDKHTQEATHCINGDTYPDLESWNKSNHASAWREKCYRTDAILLVYARSIGFDDADFGVGLYPVLTKGLDTCITVPHS